MALSCLIVNKIYIADYKLSTTSFEQIEILHHHQITAEIISETNNNNCPLK